MWVGGCVSESIYKGISPGGCRCIAAVEQGRGWMRASSQQIQQTSLKNIASHGCTLHSSLLIYLFWLGGKCMFSGVGYQWQERSKSDTTNEAVKMARQLGPEANIPRSHIFIMIAGKPQHSKKERKKGRKKKRKTIISPTREKERETKRAPLYHCCPWWNELWMCGGDLETMVQVTRILAYFPHPQPRN